MSSLKGREYVASQAYQFFLSKGLQPHQAAALAGNMAWESGGNPGLVNPGDNWKNSPRSPHSFGLGQWNDRIPGLIQFARSQGAQVPQGDLTNQTYVRSLAQHIPIDMQLKFAWHEMQGPERRAFQMIQGARDLREATAGAISYHRPAGWSWRNPYNGHGFGNRFGIASEISGMPAGSYAPPPTIQQTALASPAAPQSGGPTSGPPIMGLGAGPQRVQQSPLGRMASAVGGMFSNPQPSEPAGMAAPSPQRQPMWNMDGSGITWGDGSRTFTGDGGGFVSAATTMTPFAAGSRPQPQRSQAGQAYAGPVPSPVPAARPQSDDMEAATPQAHLDYQRSTFAPYRQAPAPMTFPPIGEPYAPSGQQIGGPPRAQPRNVGSPMGGVSPNSQLRSQPINFFDATRRIFGDA